MSLSKFYQNISIHAPVRGATDIPYYTPSIKSNFNSRSRAGSDFLSLRGRRFAKIFQFTLPCGERRHSLLHPFHKIKFQFTLPCGERLLVIAWAALRKNISIHAPVRGATFVRENPREFEKISIHAPVRGATLETIKNFKWYLFQFTLPCGERRSVWNYIFQTINISIHAPVRGATQSLSDVMQQQSISIHAPVRGATF